MVYPIVIVLVMLGVIFLLSYFVLPNLTEMISDNGAELPWITKVVMGMADFIRGSGGGYFVASDSRDCSFNWAHCSY